MAGELKIQYRVYYDAAGKVVTYTTEDLPGNWIQVTPMQFAEARSDAVVVAGKLTTKHNQVVLYKLVKNLSTGTATSKYDINILTDSGCNYWNLQQNDP